jgi:predicted CopG family antitoxin
VTKTITVRDEVYRKLLRVKREGESFSDLFDRLVEGAADSLDALKKLRGCVELSSGDKECLLAEVYEARR